MATIVKTIGSAGGRDYSTVAAWSAALPANLVTDGNSQEGDMYNDSEFVENTSITGHTTDSTHTILLTTGAGQSFRDSANAQTNALRYNQSNGVGWKATSNYSLNCSIGDSNMTVSKIQLATGGNYSQPLTVAGTSIKIDGCILEALHSNVINVGSSTSLLVTNTLLNVRATNKLCVSDSSASPTFANCTFVTPAGNTNGVWNSSSGSTSPTLKNCAWFGFAGFVQAGTVTPAGSNNCSDLAIAFGTSNQASKTYSNQFQNITDATRDYRIKTGADCVDNGVTDTTDIPAAIDIVGTARPQSTAWDIGCWELVVAGIAFDAAGNSGDQAAASSYSGSASWSGTNRALAVDVSLLGAAVTVTGMTYGGAACRFIGARSTVTSFGRIEQWIILSGDSGAPAVGSNTLAVTLSGSLEFSVEWVSYTDINQISPTEGFNSNQATNAGSATDASVVVTTTSDKCWIHAAVVANDTSITANQTSRNNISGTLGSGANEDNNAQVTPAGSTTMSYTGMGITATWAIAGYALRPTEDPNPSPFISQLMLMGIGT